MAETSFFKAANLPGATKKSGNYRGGTNDTVDTKVDERPGLPIEKRGYVRRNPRRDEFPNTPEGFKQFGTALQEFKGGERSFRPPVATGDQEGITDLSKIETIEDANNILKNFQENVQVPTTSIVEGREKPGAMQTFKDFISEYGFGERPKTPSLMEQFTQLREERGLDTLEDELNELDAVEQGLISEQEGRIRALKTGEGLRSSVFRGRREEILNQTEELDLVRRQKRDLNNQITTSQGVINQIMNLTGQDFTNSRQDYNDQFSQKMKLYDSFTAAQKEDKTDEQLLQEKAENRARANLEIIYNNTTQGNLDFESLDDNTKTAISQLELQSGMPIGTINALRTKHEDGEMVTSVQRESGGQKFLDVVMRKPDGSTVVENILLGSVTGKTGGNIISKTQRKGPGGQTFLDVVTQDAEGNFKTESVPLGKRSAGTVNTDGMTKEEKAFQKDAFGLIDDLTEGSIGVEDATRNLKAKYDEIPDDVIDQFFGAFK